ncbi:unnamed protein product [Linum trigynum]|uniref:RNase H type-1 domain-containing protein n=1 Tax=Linum trigynum TaxID=586398 RepID=A0AAV2CJ99_9ROSI
MGQIVAMKRSNHSSLWKAILKAIPLMKSAAVWSIRNGKTTSFWHHPWLEHDLFLKDNTLQDDPTTLDKSAVADWVDDNGEWDWIKLQDIFPPNILALIAGMEPPKDDLGEDKCIWGLERDGRFRLKSAYKLDADQLDSTGEAFWKELWKWKGPSRTKHFLWLVMHDRLLTNKERVKRKLATDGNCNFCKDTEETTEHILRNYRKTKGIWEKFNAKVTCKDTSLPFKTWMLRNLKDDDHGVDFGLIVWHLWKQRNEECLDGKSFVEKSLLCRIEAWFNIFKMALKNVERSFAPPTVRREELIGWKPPPDGWVQIQSDGSVLSPSGSAAAGGLIRDCLGRCSVAYACNLGVCSITVAELKGAAVGLQIAWDQGHRRVHLNLDSSTAVAIIKNCSDDYHRHGLLAIHVNNLLNRDWDVVVSHVYREGNCTADYLAEFGHSLPFGTHHVDVCNPDLCRWLEYDVLRISQPRSINI